MPQVWPSLVLAAVVWGVGIFALLVFFRGMRALMEIPVRLERIERLLAAQQGRDEHRGI